MNWKKSGGYHEEHQFIREDGRIAGHVSGSEFQSDNGWFGFDESVIPALPLGRYERLDQAKRAVEKAVATREVAA